MAKPAPRIAILGIALESNNWAAPTRRADFEAYAMLRGEDILQSNVLRYWLGGDGLPGFCEAMSQSGDWTPVPILVADGQSGGPMVHEDYIEMRDEMLAILHANLPVDGVYIVAHGAGTTTEIDDLDGDYMSQVRALIGEDVPIVATLDLHANPTRAMIASCDALIAQRTNPHVDSAARACDAAQLMRRMVAGERFWRTAVRLPLLTPQLTQRTDPGEVLGDIMPLAESALDARILEACSLLPGFALADTYEGGFWLYGCSKDAVSGRLLLSSLARAVWESRDEFAPRLVRLDDAIAEARYRGREARPIVLADIADNPGGGGSGSTTWLLKAAIAAGLDDAALGLMIDPALVAIATDLGEGASFEAIFSSDSTDPFTRPLTCPVRVEWAGSGDYDSTTGVYAGSRVPLGPSCRLRVGGIDVLVASNRQQALGEDVFAHFGVDVESTRVFIVKSRGHFRAGFKHRIRAEDIIEVDAPGLTTAMLQSLDFKRVIRPVFPLDDVYSRDTIRALTFA